MKKRPDESLRGRLPRIGLALGGGGARGFAHLGAVQALQELGLPLYCVAGTSIGSIVGAVIASNGIDRAIEWAHKPDWLKLPSLFLKLHVPKRALLSSERIGRFLCEMIAVKSFADLSMPFAAVATDLFSGETVVMRDGDVHSAIRASMAIPGIFEPVSRGGRLLVDGGLTNPVPVDVCRELGAERVIAININARAKCHTPPPISKLNLITILDQILTNVCDRTAKETFVTTRPDCVLNPTVADIMMLDFRGADKLIAIGYDCAMSHKAELLRIMEPLDEGTKI